jgi:hypothetical protein
LDPLIFIIKYLSASVTEVGVITLALVKDIFAALNPALDDMAPAIVKPFVPLIMPEEYMLPAERPVVLNAPVIVSPDNFTYWLPNA